MSDFDDQAMGRLSTHVSLAYAALAAACAALPVPITLPIGKVSNVETGPAVARVMDLVRDQPMPEEQQAQLFAVCAFWLAALDLYGLLVKEGFTNARAHSAAANLLMAEDQLGDVLSWLREQKE
ncbi:hypothetical protein [Streptomyces sp. NPDC088182]|uniref:hypothetical protein n=1 Tax=Streptomyces sp. NPDC088182 TaxID=3365838 RepID=UPI00382404BD